MDSTEGLLQTIRRDGVAVVPSLLNAEECQRMRTGCWDMISHLTSRMDTPFDHNDPDTYASFYKLLPVHGMLIQHWGVGHAQWVWDVRTHPRVVSTFANLWSVSERDLLVSFDGISYAPPHETTRRGYYRPGKDWYHSDQSFRRNDLECVQGWVTANDVREGDATLTYLEGSHRFHKDFADAFPDSKKKSDDWYKLSSEELEWYETTKACVRRTVECPAGSLVLWDSRVIHAGKEATRDRAQSNERVIAYVCCTPRSMASDRVIAKRIKAFEDSRMTTHWPHKCKLFGKMPRTYGNADLIPDCPPLPRPDVDNDIARALIGYNRVQKKLKF